MIERIGPEQDITMTRLLAESQATRDIGGVGVTFIIHFGGRGRYRTSPALQVGGIAFRGDMQ